MSHLTSGTSGPPPSLTQLAQTLEAMREAGWLIDAPVPPTVDATEPLTATTRLPEEFR